MDHAVALNLDRQAVLGLKSSEASHSLEDLIVEGADVLSTGAHRNVQNLLVMHDSVQCDVHQEGALPDTR